MFELFIVIILVLVVRMVIIKAKSFYKVKKKHREIMKLFEPERVPFKVRWGLKRFFRKSKFKPNKATKEGLGLLKYPKVKRTSRIAQVNLICLPILFMWDYGLFLIPIIIGASEMFDWTQDVLKLPPCCRTLVRNNSGYWFCAMINNAGDPYLIESRNDGVNWGTNHSDYNDNTAVKLNQETNGATSWHFLYGADYDTISLAVTDDNKMHIFAITPDVRGYNHLFTYSGSSNGDISSMGHDFWRGYSAGVPYHADNVVSVADGNTPHSGTIVAHGNLVCCIWSQKIVVETGKYEILYRKRNSLELDIDGGSWAGTSSITSSSADNNYYPCLAKDSNGHFHTAWRNDNGDNTIKYGHAHTDNQGTWYQSDDVSAITTGESGETIMTEAGKDFDIPSLCINPLPDLIDDIWVSGYLLDDDELYAIQYDKSAGTWQAKAKFSATDQVDANGQLGVSADGKIHALWSLITVGGIRHSEYDTSWSAPDTLQS